jgi:uncharacterized protein (TIGR02246 family)
MRFLTGIILYGMLAGSVTAQRPPSAAETDVRQASEGYWAAYQAGDAAKVAAQFTETGVLMIPGLPDAEGRAAVSDVLRKRFAGLRIKEFKVTRREIDVTPDAAYELGWFVEVSQFKEDDPMQMEGRHLIVWKHAGDNRWLVHRHFYNFSAAKQLTPSSN